MKCYVCDNKIRYSFFIRCPICEFTFCLLHGFEHYHLEEFERDHILETIEWEAE